MDGRGIIKYFDGTVYSGSFRNNAKHGFGKIDFAGGPGTYSGEFRNDSI